MLSPDEGHRDDVELGPLVGGSEVSARPGAACAAAEPPAPAPFADTSAWAIQPLPTRFDDAGARWVPGLLAAMRRRWRLLLLGALVGVGFAGAYLYVADRIYVVKTLLLVERRGSVFSERDPRVGGGPIETHAEVYQSPALVAEALGEIGIPAPEGPSLLGSVRGWLASIGILAPADAPVDPLAAALLETVPALQASPVVGTDIIAVTLRTDAAERGVRLLDALTARYREHLREREAAAQREGLAVLRERAATLDARIAAATGRYEALAARLGVLGEGEVGVAARRMSLEEHARARADAEGRRIDVENELAALRESPDARIAPSLEIGDELLRAEAGLSEARSSHTPRHPVVQQAEQQVAGLREQIRVATAQRAHELERELHAARGVQAALAELQVDEWREVAALESGRSAAGAVAAEIARLEEQRGAVLALLAQKELAVLAAEAGVHRGTLVRVLEEPSLPPRPVWPLPVPVLLACGSAGFVLALAAALLLQARAGPGPGRSASRVGDRAPADPGHYADAPSAVAERRAPGH